MHYRKRIVFAFLFLISAGFSPSSLVYCSDLHSNHAHHTNGIEAGLSIGYVHLNENVAPHKDHDHTHGTEKTYSDDAAALHLHVGKRLSDTGLLARLGLGVGGEIIFAEHAHYALMLPVTVYPWRGLVLGVAPGIKWAEHEGERESAYTTHVEAAYVLEIRDFDIGPVMGYAKTEQGEHYMLGIHFGVHF